MEHHRLMGSQRRAGEKTMRWWREVWVFMQQHSFSIHSEVFFWCRLLPGWAWLEPIFPALFFALGVVQLLNREQVTADDPLSSQQGRQGAAVCPWKQEEAEPDWIPGRFWLLPRKNWTGWVAWCQVFSDATGRSTVVLSKLARRCFRFICSGFKCSHARACVCVCTWHTYPLQKRLMFVWIWRRRL